MGTCNTDTVRLPPYRFHPSHAEALLNHIESGVINEKNSLFYVPEETRSWGKECEGCFVLYPTLCSKIVAQHEKNPRNLIFQLVFNDISSLYLPALNPLKGQPRS